MYHSGTLTLGVNNVTKCVKNAYDATIYFSVHPNTAF